MTKGAPKFDMDGWMQLKPSTIVYGFGLIVSGAVWAVSQSITSAQHTETIKDVQGDVKAISKAMAEFRQEQAMQGMEIHYLVNGRRGTPPASNVATNPPTAAIP